MKTKKEILSSKREIKHCYIIYALISNNEIVYIGQSTNILNRLSTHLSSFKEFDSWTIIENLGDFTTSKEVNRLEEKYIRKFLPKYNKIHNKIYQKKVYNKNQKYAEIEKKLRIKKLWLRSQTGIVNRKKINTN
tara:strand:- start:239 stop:640 length:402 start_codon:yes stop_codon:yes gene_type:complete